LGQKVTELARAHYWTVGVDLQEEPLGSVDEYLILDISQRDAVLDATRRVSPTAIINTAALTNVDACERDRDQAWSVNVDGVRHLMEASRREDCLIVQISSDYVFDGENGPYDEDAQPNPLGFYGLTKLESERVLAGGRLPWAVLRTNVLYGWANGVRLNFALWVRAHLSAGKYIHTAIDQYGNPTQASNLAHGVVTILRGKHSGIYHIAGLDYLSRWAFAQKIAEVFKLNQNLISPVVTSQLSQRAPRPHWGGLKTDKTITKLGIELCGVQSGLEALKGEVAASETEER
jgi:dTDP-4-dehydrorhamnose reductase